MLCGQKRTKAKPKNVKNIPQIPGVVHSIKETRPTAIICRKKVVR